MSDDDSDEDEWGDSAVVIDNGSCWIKSGYAGDDSPRYNTPALIKYENSVKFPIQHGIITNKDDMELLWHNIFENEFKIDVSERCVLLTDAALNPVSTKEDMVEIMFETFDVPATYIGM